MNRINPLIFREYDIRGVVGEDITETNAYIIGRAYGTLLRRHNISCTVLARDNRLSSYAYSRAVLEALCDTGIDVTDVGMTTTPVFYFSRMKYGIEGGVMVTGSHNPPEFNGFKLGFGRDTLFGKGIQEVREIAETGDFENGSGTVTEKDPLPDYAGDIAGRIQLGPKGVFCIVDAGNGSAGPVVRQVLDGIGARYEALFFEPDGNFPNHHPDPTQVRNLEQLINRVRETKADLGIAFDGDADRIGVVDSSGKPVWGDELQTVFWREILEKHPGALALIEVKCSQALVDVVRELGGKPEFTRTGHSLIKARMRETGALFTGEMSGHMFFRDEYYGFDDAIYAAARLLRLLSNSDKSLDELISLVPKYYSTPEVRVDCPDECKFQVVDSLKERFSKQYETITVDGVRVILPGGWGLVRASNTQPALVLRAEGRTQSHLEEIKQIIEEELAGHPQVGRIIWD
ncbi:MAG: phosphomannomutase/phosphoglucomutase [Bacillota bacterium]|jgi:phosphomannomutase/phosphoglucomutase|nr:phosphomannomutase/phosphoglucomutase [Candidatus Fermentithermobacillaceae bacterium]